ncbi:hypothetical protein SDC9_144351 [bioreactor metagenome]|uniref:Uncharacterized protein n=1 Tax=bioreactor metagenome TaxID=1076179 RepID=A0A645E7H6_9ZZZZ
MIIPAADKHILGDGQIWAQRDFLIDGADAEILGILRRFNRDLTA